MPQNAASDQIFYCLQTECHIKIQIKGKISPNIPTIGNGLAQLSMIGESFRLKLVKVSKKAKIRNRYKQVPHLTQDTTWESDTSLQFC